MAGIVPVTIGDQVRLRKPHACGNDTWEVTRTGMDIRMRCLKCARRVVLPRTEFERQLKEFLKSTRGLTGEPSVGRPPTGSASPPDADRHS